jgi:hypothetical protein
VDRKQEKRDSRRKGIPKLTPIFTGVANPSNLPSGEHIGIVQKFEEVQCLSRPETRYFLVVGGIP